MIASGTIITPELEADWLVERRRSIGASEIAAVMGVSKWKTPVDLWQEKTGRRKPDPENSAMRWGKKLEPLILDEYEAVTQNPVVKRQLFLRDVNRPYLTATLDGMTAGSSTVVEAKSSSSSDGWGDFGSDEIPEQYIVQVQQQMMLSRAICAVVPALLNRNDFRIFVVPRNNEIIALLKDKADEFWHCVQNDTPPTWGKLSAADLAVINPRCEGEIQADAGLALEAVAYEDAVGRAKYFSVLADEAKENVLTKMGCHKSALLPDGRVVKRYLEQTEARTQTVNYKASTRHYFRIMKGNAK